MDRPRPCRLPAPGQGLTKPPPGTTLDDIPGPSLPSGPGETSPPGPAKESAMQTNGANGHQHEVFRKRDRRPAPSQPGSIWRSAPAGPGGGWTRAAPPPPPWQFINLGTKKPAGNEGAGVAPRTTPKSALDGLITCGRCGKPMLRDDTQGDQEACYACQSRCPTPRLHALRAEVLLVRTAAANSPDRGEHLQGAGGGERPPAVRHRM